MRAQQIVEALAQLDDEILQEADALRQPEGAKRAKAGTAQGVAQAAAATKDTAQKRQREGAQESAVQKGAAQTGAAPGTGRGKKALWLRRYLPVAAACLLLVAAMGLAVLRRSGTLPTGQPQSDTDTAPADSAGISGPGGEQTDTGGANSTPDSAPDGAPDASNPFGDTPGACQTIDPTLPRLPAVELDVGGMGFEGYLAYDISDLSAVNPLQPEAPPAKMPVFESGLYSEMGRLCGGDFAAMEARLRRVAAGLGLDAEGLTVTDDTPSEEEQQAIRDKYAAVGDEVPEGYFEPSRLLAEAEGIELEVDAALTVTIRFEPAVELPPELTFAHGEAGYDETVAIADWLAERYAGLLAGMQQPTADITGGDYTYSGVQSFGICFYDAAGDQAQRLIHYAFNRVTFACDDEGKLFIARVYAPDLSQVVAEYPIISVERAWQRLQDGNYLTSVPCPPPTDRGYARVELVYLGGTSGGYIDTGSLRQPCYRFYIELTAQELGQVELENGLKTYGAYYVPAIEPDYFEGQ